MKPVIGISTRLRLLPSSSGDQPAHTVTRHYTDAVRSAGGIPFLVAPGPPVEAPLVLDHLDGLVLTGGGDVAAARHGRHHHASMYGVDEERDGFELALVSEAVARRTPLMAVCRGVQVVNVALGGDLILDIPAEIENAIPHWMGGDELFVGHQQVRLDPSSRLAQLLGTHQLLVNSMHHQAVRRVGTGLRAVGWADDEVVEAVEPTDHEWALWGVQWHPECLAADDAFSRRLFEAHVAAAAKRLI